MTTLPEIRIRHSRLMTRAISPILLAHARGPEAKMPENKYFIQRLKDYQDAWEPLEQPVVSSMMEVLGLSFYLPVIDATVAPMVPAFSTPLTLNYRREPDEFVDMLTHELVHILLSDNREKISFDELSQHNWPAEDQKTRAHILVHAVLEHVYVETLKQPYRLSRDIASNQQNPPYRRAWEIVAQQGCDTIINQMHQYITDRA